MNPNSGRKKWVITIVIAAVLIAAAVAVAIFAGQGPDDPVVDTPKESPIGLYYYDTAEGEYLLTLSEGNVFMISGPSLNKSGKCVVTDNGIELDFVKDEDGTGSLKEENGVMTLQYKDKTMRFLEKKTYKVNFNVNGGSEVAAINVVNGKTVSKPADPKKDGSVFIGWYADADCTKLYGFGNEVITADTTVYAKWAETVVGQNEYTVNFDLGYEAEGFAAMSTIGGKLYNVPAPTRDGYTFAGWWVSQTQNAEQLTIPYVEDMVFQANTTLFALWTTTPTGGKLAAPMVEVYADSIKWNTIQGASTYLLKILDAENNVIHEEKLGANAKNFDFATRAAGEYTVQVTALASTEEKNSETVTRTFINKALDRVSLFTVIDGGILLWNGVEGAEKYLITIDCGNDAHKHTAFDNGDSTTFMFKNCSMQAGGIKFTVTAVADDMASSVSETFVYDRKLDAVGEILYNEDTQSFYWDAVANAAKYSITVKVGGKTFTVDNGSATTFSAKYLSGDITLEIIPMTQGYNSPEATTTTYKKTSLATPEGLTVNGTTLSWNPVEGATGYMVKVNNQSFQAESNSLDLTTTTLSLDSSTTYDICVMAVGTESSLYSDVVTMKYLADIENVIYKNNTVTWTPVMGVENYEIRVNGEVVETVSGKNFAQIELTKAGINVIEVRYTDLGGSKWIGTEVFAYEVIYDSRSLNGVEKEYLAIGDTMRLPSEYTIDGYDFTGWYNAPDAANGNGAAITESQFTGMGTVILYANWTPRTYYVEFVGLEGVTNLNKGDKHAVTYQDGYQLPIPENVNAGGDFVGWYTGPGASGTALTDSLGNCITEYQFTRDTVAYPFFDTGVLSYELQSDGTYAVKKGPSIENASNVRIPEYYKGVKVTTVLDNAFYGVSTMVKLEIPATIKTIGIAALPASSTLKEIVVYEDTIQQNYEIFYSSHDGALLRHDMGTTYLEFFPRGMTGEYTISDEVDVIRDKVFSFAKISKVIVGKNVSLIMRNAFYGCDALEVLEFKSEGTVPLTIDPRAFYGSNNLTAITLPARLKEMDLQILNQFTRLSSIEVEEGGVLYSAMDGILCNAAGTAILYAPLGVSGEFTIPMGIREVGANAFAGRRQLTKIIIPNYVNVIGDSAFQNCISVTEVVIEGGRSNDLQIGKTAFLGCDNVEKVTFQGNGTTKVDSGITTIGTSAFEGIKQLNTVTFEAGVNIVIGQRAFAASHKLTNLVYEDGAYIQGIGKQAYADCTQLAKAVIPGSVLSVEDGAFSGCEAVREVIFESGDHSISFGSNVFAGCKHLTTIHLPAGVGYFDGSALAGCDAITEINVDPANPNFATYEGALYTKDYSEILFYPKTLDGDLSKLHPELKRIGANVFEGNPKIISVNISKNIVSIGNNAFGDCYALTTVTFEAGGTSLSIGNGAFAKCDVLTAISLPAYTTIIGDSAFESTPLTSFVIPESVTSLGAMALKATKITEINIPAACESIGDGAFANCTNLTTITFEEGDKDLTIGTLTNSGYSNGVFYNTKIKEIALPDRATTFGKLACYRLSTLTSFTMGPNSRLTTIGPNAFVQAKNLKTVTLGPKLETIGGSAFSNCNLIDGITIPKSVTLIDQQAFANSKLTKLIFEPDGTAELTIGNYAFNGNKLTEVTLPARLTNAYEDVKSGVLTGSWKNFYTRFANNTTLEAINVEPGGEKFASIDGIVYELDEDGNPTILLYCPVGRTGEVVIPKEVRLVENAAFNKTKVTSVVFEEYDKEHENYGKPLLVVGSGVSNYYTVGTQSTYAVFMGDISNIKFPSHLKRLGAVVCHSLNKAGTTVTFNLDAHLDLMASASFRQCNGITELKLPAIDEMGPGAIYQNTKLTTITLAADSQLKTLPQFALAYNSALTAFHVPSSVTKIDMYAFGYCTALSAVTFDKDSQLLEVGNNAFRASGLTDFTMPDTLAVFGQTPFRDCKKLKTVTIGANVVGVTSSNYSIFYLCPALENILVSEDNLYFKSIDGVLYDMAETIVYCFPQAKNPANYKMPDTVTTIEMDAFYGFSGTGITLSENLENIGARAFMNSQLTSLHLPRRVLTIAANAFQAPADENVSLQTLTFAENCLLTSIGNSAFANNNKLVSVSLPDNVKEMGTKVFGACAALEDVILPAALTVLPGLCFDGCPNLKTFVIQEGTSKIDTNAIPSTADKPNTSLTELVIPSTVVEIGDNAFAYLTALKTVTFAEGSKLDIMGYGVFANCSALEGVTLPASLMTLKTKTVSYTLGGKKYEMNQSLLFANCVSMKFVDMSQCHLLSEIPSEMLTGCTGVQSVLLPVKLVTIHDFAFGSREVNGIVQPGLTSLKEIAIPATVTSIGGYAFNGCSSLETVTFGTGSQLTELGIGERQQISIWGEQIFAGTTALKSVKLPEKLTTIGVGCFENSSVADIVLPETVTVIGERAFKNCDNIVDAGLPANLQYVGDEAYYDCNSLEVADLSFGLEYLGSVAFAYCDKLKNVYIPATVLSLSSNPFSGCSGVESFVLDSDNAAFKIVNGVMYDSTVQTVLYYPASLTAETYEFPASVQKIGPGAFAGAKVKIMAIPDRITEIPESAFQRSTLESITLHNSLKTIGDYAFEGCRNLNNVKLPNSVEYAGNYAFANCTGLSAFTFEDIAENDVPYTIGTHFFDGCTAMTQVILPNSIQVTQDDYDEVGALYDRSAVIPSYMFANSGIVHAVIPKQIEEIATTGVFSNCKQLETVTFESFKLDGDTIGQYYFYGCSKLKELAIPAGIYTPINAYAYAECTSLEKLTIYTDDSYFETPGYGFVGCTNLKQIEILSVKYEYDENRQVIGYASVKKDGFYSVNSNAFAGASGLKHLVLDHFEGASLSGTPFAGSSIEVLVIKRAWNIGDGSQAPFVGATSLKEIWIGGPGDWFLTPKDNTFAELDHDVNIYFYNYTREEAIDEVGNDRWLQNASEKAHFYFKDTIPEGTEIPEGV